jgi:hypothetical protein
MRSLLTYVLAASARFPSSNSIFLLPLLPLLLLLLQLNFIIAIIVDSYAVVNEEVKELESHQEFFTDLTGVIW